VILSVPIFSTHHETRQTKMTLYVSRQKARQRPAKCLAAAPTRVRRAGSRMSGQCATPPASGTPQEMAHRPFRFSQLRTGLPCTAVERWSREAGTSFTAASGRPRWLYLGHASGPASAGARRHRPDVRLGAAPGLVDGRNPGDVAHMRREHTATIQSLAACSLGWGAVGRVFPDRSGD
jgi:hypothetical protein